MNSAAHQQPPLALFAAAAQTRVHFLAPSVADTSAAAASVAGTPAAASVVDTLAAALALRQVSSGPAGLGTQVSCSFGVDGRPCVLSASILTISQTNQQK